MKSLNLYLIPNGEPLSVLFNMSDHTFNVWCFALDQYFMLPPGEFGARFDYDGKLLKFTKL